MTRIPNLSLLFRLENVDVKVTYKSDTVRFNSKLKSGFPYAGRLRW